MDLELFAECKKIQDAINAHSCSEALLWCQENKSALKKIKSTFEFNLRFQEYVELVRNRQISQAIVYSKKYLTSWSETHMKEIQQAMALLAFNPKTSCGIYKVKFKF